MLQKERKKLRDTSAFTVLDYIKTSIEILMNMKMEEHDEGGKIKNGTGLFSDTESLKSTDDPPKDYE